MRRIFHVYKKEKKHYSIWFENEDDLIYNKLGESDVIIKNFGTRVILKIIDEKDNKSNKIFFERIIKKKYWYGKYNGTDDLIILNRQKRENCYSVNILENQWKYRLLIIDLIVHDRYSYNKL